MLPGRAKDSKDDVSESKLKPEKLDEAVVPDEDNGSREDAEAGEAECEKGLKAVLSLRSELRGCIERKIAMLVLAGSVDLWATVE